MKNIAFVRRGACEMRLNPHEVRLNIKMNIEMNILARGSMDQMGGWGVGARVWWGGDGGE